MEALFVLFIVLAIITVVGYVIWLGLAAVYRWVFVDETAYRTQVVPRHDPVLSKLVNLKTAEQQIVELHQDGKLNDQTYEEVMSQIRAKRSRLVNPNPKPAEAPAPSPAPCPFETTPAVVSVVQVEDTEEIVIKPVPSFMGNDAPPRVEPPPAAPPRPPRRSFSEVLNAFMEESNIRWGEIIGGLLIIGCSTALVVSLWAQISEIPVLKFLIFTTVTAILFGIGLYTEHRWKLPTTSRGILTIATLLVPLNFLAIAAVSASNTSGGLVIGSELVAPGIFLCLVYFAGRIITPGCAHILSAGVLGSSVGQLLVRHFASADASPWLLIFLGAFPVLCYAVTVGLALRVVLHDHEIDETETTTVFTALGTMSFAALLPFGLLLYKSGPIGMSMMYLAPLVTLWGLPMLATGTILWRKISNRELVASRTAGTALGILGLMIVLAGMILAWPNPASIVPAALLNFAVFTALAIALRLSVGHLIAAICFALAFVVTGHVMAGNITWENLRVMSLLGVSLSVSSGQLLIGAVALFIVVSEWLSQRGRAGDSYYYLVAACVTAIVSLALATVFGIVFFEANSLWIVYGLYALGAFWIAWRRQLAPFTWVGVALLLFSLAHNFSITGFAFPWQTALFAHATICALAAIVSASYNCGKVLSKTLNYAALISIVLGVVSLFQANTWEVTWMQAQRVFWIAGILLLLHWLNRRLSILNAFQIALICALVLTVKAALQGFEWYSYLPHAFLHPAALQIQGTVLTLFCLTWILLRLFLRRPIVDYRYTIDQFLIWLLIPAFLLLALYGSVSGTLRELLGLRTEYAGFDVANFPHTEALGLGSWIVLGLLIVAMLLTYWERRRRVFLLGALAVLSGIIPLLAGQFENQLATATAWRWLAAAFLLVGSLTIWSRRKIAPSLSDSFVTQFRNVLLALTIVPIIVLTMLPTLRAIDGVTVHTPISGVFSLLDTNLLYGVPLVVVALVLIGFALRERMPEFGLYAGACINATVTLAYLLAVSRHGSIDPVDLVRLVQLNAITFAIYLLPWLSTRQRWQTKLSDVDQRFAGFLLKFQLFIAVLLNAVLLAQGLISVMLWRRPGEGTIAIGGSLGWFSLFTAVVAGFSLSLTRTIRLSVTTLGALLLSVACLTAAHMSSLGGDAGVHTLTVFVSGIVWLLFAAAELTQERCKSAPFPINLIPHVFDLDRKWTPLARALATVGGVFVFVLSIRNATPGAHRWWSIWPLLGLTLFAATFSWRTKMRAYVFAAGLLFYISVWWILIDLEKYRNFIIFLLDLVIANSLAALLWLWLDLRARQSERAIRYYFSFHHITAIFVLGIFALLVVLNVSVDLDDHALSTIPGPTWLAFLSVTTLMLACLLDRYAKYAVVGLYVLGLIACALVLEQLDLVSTRFAWAVTLILAAYSLGVALVWHWRRRLISFATQLHVPERMKPGATQLWWLSVLTCVALVTLGILAYWINVNFVDFSLRVTAALAFLAQCLTIGLLAEGVKAKHSRRVAILVGVIGVIFVGWSWLTPFVNSTWLNRSVILMVVVFGMTALYGLVLDKLSARFSAWTTAARACVPWVIGAGVLALFFCLGTEVRYQLDFGAVLIHPLALITIGLTLVAAVVISVLFALSPNHDPLSLSERGRMKYVYAGEVMLALLFLHIRLTMPWLFTGFIERYWPLVVMLIAYFGVMTSEALRRRQLLVLAQPLERTGAFVPLLPVLGFWVVSSEVDFSMLLFIVGGLYGLLSILRRSFGFGVVAALAGNAGLWYAFQRTEDYQFLQHPQLWLVPVALSVLIAAYLNEEKLTEDQMTGVRYLSLVTIYVSSTADIFINGVANSPWLPLILGSFSLAGVFAGILFRIRGLLLLGSIFLLLSIVTMIWYASANFGWTWLWYVAGIVTGATIIFMFAVFEKNRPQRSTKST
ncbi:MAG TPA: hypothetical protein VJR02_09780 [Pyrinomonadaceae bacterium]|nr:hypothetical protein [Pyrinomonadaceae bacterium]